MSYADAERLPPQNLEAEQGVLAGIIREPRWADEVRLEGLRPEHFYRASHAETCRALFALADSGRPCDPISVADELTRRGEFDRIGGDDFLAGVMGSVPHAANTGYLAHIVREKARQRALIESASEVLRHAYRGTSTADDLIAAAAARLDALAEDAPRRHDGPLGDAAAEVMGRLARRDRGEYTGLPTGFPELDADTDGLPDRSLVVLGARPAMGKSALAMNVCEHAAFTLGVPSLFVSLEMDRVSLAQRVIASRADVYAHKLRDPGQLSPEDRRALACAAAELAECDRLFVDDAPGRSLAEVAALCRRYRARRGIGLVVIDYLQLVRPDDDGRSRDSRQEQIARISRRLKALARELELPVLALSQLNRAVEHRREGKAHAQARPTMADLRESGQIEQDADLVLLLHRPEYYDPAASPGVAEVIVAKNREGATGTVKLLFRPAFPRFEPFAPGPLPPVEDF